MAKTLFNIRKETFPEHREQGCRKQNNNRKKEKIVTKKSKSCAGTVAGCSQ
jgi:hypothetical protein